MQEGAAIEIMGKSNWSHSLVVIRSTKKGFDSTQFVVRSDTTRSFIPGDGKSATILKSF